ncbi:bifunctional 3-(3-hydroxy-phenyl)propionate/3-hydroxycinnamic acid hydroxylase [Pseudonocardia sp. GCM10023141]|uniref:bifunctional 3-(3-hydroxy-phenyl)propionate/3-hydroxycinnamic acid hydroxylase MhpA n=1 Tax=Pseudonocardia sp. GCM10023141 TaxID=3252653 RepID=UPI0036114CC0
MTSSLPAAQNATPDSQFDVIIVGGGPTGLVTAALLGRNKHRVAVVERHPQPYGLPRAGHVDHEVMRVLQGIDSHQALIDDGVTNPVYRWLNGRGEMLLSFTRGDSISGFLSDYMMYQPVLEDALHAALARCANNVTLLMGWEAASVSDQGVSDQGDDGVTLTIRRHDSDETGSLHARYLLGADGARSTIRESLGLAQTDLGFSEDWLDIDVKLLRPLRFDPDGQFCDPARPAYVGPLGKRHHRFEYAALPGETWAELERPETAWKLLNARGFTPDDMEIVRQVVYRFEAKLADSWRRGNVMLVGDSAHTMPPHFGQGLCSGVRDAANIAWKLDLVLRRRAPATLLDAYETERKPHARQWIENSVAVGRISCILDPAAAAERDARILSGEAPSFPRPNLSTGVLQSRDGTHPWPPAGDFSPQGVVSDRSTKGLLHDVVGHGFILLVRGDDPRPALSTSTRAVLDRLDVRVHWFSANANDDTTLADIDGVYTAYFDTHDTDAVLIRPDYYVFGVARPPGGIEGLIGDLAAAIDDDTSPSAGSGA